MISHPERELQLISRRFLAFWSGGTPYPLDDFLKTSSLQFRYVLIFNVAVAFGALVGIFVLVRQRSPYCLLMAVFPIIFPLTYYLTMVVPRYRLPIDPVLMLLTTLAVSKRERL